VLGTVGEPINPEAWLWYHRVVGGQQCSIVDTYWQTETGGHLLTPLPGAVQTKPGSACLPFFGVEPEILDEVGKCLQIFNFRPISFCTVPVPVTEKRVKRDKIVEMEIRKFLSFLKCSSMVFQYILFSLSFKTYAGSENTD
jgi:hypothetical protein